MLVSRSIDYIMYYVNTIAWKWVDVWVYVCYSIEFFCHMYACVCVKIHLPWWSHHDPVKNKNKNKHRVVSTSCSIHAAWNTLCSRHTVWGIRCSWKNVEHIMLMSHNMEYIMFMPHSMEYTMFTSHRMENINLYTFVTPGCHPQGSILVMCICTL